MSDIEVVHNADAQQYEIHVDGTVAGLTKAVPRDDGVVELPHTEISDAFEGQGLASTLVAGALGDIRRRGLTIHPTCEYVQHFIEKHPEHADLVAGPVTGPASM